MTEIYDPDGKIRKQALKIQSIIVSWEYLIASTSDRVDWLISAEDMSDSLDDLITETLIMQGMQLICDNRDRNTCVDRFTMGKRQ